MSDFTVKLPSGRSVDIKNAPDGMTKQQIKEGLISRGEATEEDFITPAATAEPATQSRSPTSIYDQSIAADTLGTVAKIKNPITVPAGVNNMYVRPDIALGMQAQVDAQNEFARKDINNKERQDLRKRYAEEGLLDNIGQGISNIGAQLGVGTTMLANEYLPESLAEGFNYITGRNTDIPREQLLKEIRSNMDKRNEEYEIYKDENPFGTFVGETIPFTVTGGVGSKVLDLVGKGIVKGYRGARLAGAKKLAPYSEAAASNAKRFSNLQDEIPTAREIRNREIAKGTIIGAGEGAALDDSTYLQGGAAGLLGPLAHYTPLRTLNSIRNERDAAGQLLIKQLDEEGIPITPGMYTGNRTLLREEGAISRNDTYGQAYHNMITAPMNRRYMAMAGEAIGKDLKNRDKVTKMELREHGDSLSSRYKELENTTQGVYGPDEVKRMGTILKSMQPTPRQKRTQRDAQRYDVLLSVAQEMEKTFMKQPKGQRFKNAQAVDGSMYQNMRKLINDEIKQAAKDDVVLVPYLKEMRNILDTSLEKGMAPEKLQMWKDLNEQYSMTNNLIKHGLTASRSIDVEKLRSWLMSNDEVKRTLTGQGGRIKKFQDIVELNDTIFGKDRVSSDISMSDTENKRGIFRTAGSLIVDPLKEVSLRYRLNQIRTPIIGRKLSVRHGLGENAAYHTGRAAAQAQNVPQSIEDLLDMFNLYKDDSEQEERK